MPAIQKTSKLSASDVAKYFLYRATVDGDLITPLKMQKLVYLAYVKTLTKRKQKLFKEAIEAWPMGPVVPQLYAELKKYGSSPIDSEYINFKNLEELEKRLPSDIRQILDNVYEEFIVKSAFELVTLIHGDKAWIKARKGLSPDKPSKNKITDKDIISEYGS